MRGHRETGRFPAAACGWWCLAAIFLTGFLHGATPEAERWLSGVKGHPAWVPEEEVEAAPFERLRADFIAGRFKVFWDGAPGELSGDVVLVVSTGNPDQWQVRDWVRYPMERRGERYEAVVPIDHPDVSLVYFVAVFEAGSLDRDGREGPLRKIAAPGLASPLRQVWPRRLNVPAPTRIFWPHLEGFEQRVEEWRVETPGEARVGLELSGTARQGHHSLRIPWSSEQGKAQVGTTRLKGWQVFQQQALGFRFWIRTRQGEGRLRITLVSRVFTDREQRQSVAWENPLNQEWQAVVLPFEMFSSIPTDKIDYMILEVTGKDDPGALLDDLELLGIWRSE